MDVSLSELQELVMELRDSWGQKESDTTEQLNWTDWKGKKKLAIKGISQVKQPTDTEEK